MLLGGALALALLVAAGCGGAQPSKPAAPSQGAQSGQVPAAKPVDMIMATGGTGGTYYPFGGAIAKVWKDNVPGLNVTVQATGGSVENVRLLAKKEAELALSQNDVAYYGQKGEAAFKEKNEKYTNYSAIAALYPEVIQIVVRADSGIKSIGDVKGKKVAVGPPGSGTELAARQIFGTYGLDYTNRKDFQAFFLNYAEATQQFKDRQIDVMFMVIGMPAPPLADITTTTEVRLLDIAGENLAKVKQAYPFYADYTIAANTYKGQKADNKTVTLLAYLLARNDLPEDSVYNMTKTLFEKKDAIAQAHAKGKDIDLQKALAGNAIPVHPGAAKYYKEKGVTK